MEIGTSRRSRRLYDQYLQKSHQNNLYSTTVEKITMYFELSFSSYNKDTWTKRLGESRNVLTAGRGRLALQEALSIEGPAEYLRERWRQLTGSGRQL